MKEATEEHHSVPLYFHKELSPASRRRGLRGETSFCRSSPSGEVNNDDRVIVTPLRSFAPLSIGSDSTNTFVRLPSVHLPAYVGLGSQSSSRSSRRYRTSDRGEILGCVNSSSSNMSPCCCRFLVCFVIFLICYYQQLLGDRNHMTSLSNDSNGGGLCSKMETDDAYRPAIRGDYSTVMSIQDVTTLSANVPVACSRNLRDCQCAVTTTASQFPSTPSMQAKSHNSDSGSRSNNSHSGSRSNSGDYDNENENGWRNNEYDNENENGWRNNILARMFRSQKQHQEMDESVSSTSTSSLSTSWNSRIIPVPGTLNGWQSTHQVNQQMALSNDTARPNVVFYGDSITERWHGTRLGKVASKDMQDTALLFDKLFRLRGEEETVTPPYHNGNGLDGSTTARTNNSTSTSGGTTSTTTAIANAGPVLWGLPLGIAGDTTPNLLWRLQNGELPLNLNPQIFIVLIGTNDVGKDQCSPENTVVGILRVVEEILKQRPTSQLLLHGLLPRTYNTAGYLYCGATGSGSATGGRTPTKEPGVWDDIETINDELQRYARYREGVVYFDTNVFFKDLPAKQQIDMDLMPDGLHPSARGYELWGAELKGKILEMLHRT